MLSVPVMEIKVRTAYVRNYLSYVVRKSVFWFFDQVRHKSDCTAMENGLRPEISD